MLVKQHCIDCHFFSKTVFVPGKSYIFSVNKDERNRSQNKDFAWKHEGESLQCAMGVWDEGGSPVKYNLFDLTVIQNRRGKCFFMKYSPGMLMEAAKTLQNREDAHRRIKLGWYLTIIGLFISAIALIVNVILKLYSN